MLFDQVEVGIIDLVVMHAGEILPHFQSAKADLPVGVRFGEVTAGIKTTLPAQAGFIFG